MSSLRARRHLGSLLSPLFYRYVGAVRDRWHHCLQQLLETQFLPVSELTAYQEQKLRTLLGQVMKTSPWYREQLKPFGSLDSFRLQNLAELPILEKADLQTHLAEISGEGASEPGATLNYSGGSTGEPVRLWQSRLYRTWGSAELYRDFLMCKGYRLGQPRAFFWGSDVDSRDHRGIRGRLRDIASNQMWFDAFKLREQSLPNTLKQMRAFRPRLVIGYVSSLMEVARVLDRPPTGLLAVQTAAETLTDEHRRTIRETFGAPVYDRYGCREVGNIAHECDAHSGLHLLMDNNIVEIVGPDGRVLTKPGEVGDIIVTNLKNTATPLIRYRLGDVARIGDDDPCPCGRSAPRLANVLGRTSDVVATPSGRLLHGEFFTHLFYGVPVRRFRVEQLTAQDLRVEIVPNVGYDEPVRQRIVDAIKRHGDPAFRIDWVIVDHIAASPSGKYRFVVSHVEGGRA
jgi:phenylacetate-CoA ligase